jgi:hypothetical protein
MPLVKGAKAKTRKGFSENVKREKEAGKPTNQAVAIAYSEARRGKKKKPKAKAKMKAKKKAAKRMTAKKEMPEDLSY